MDMNIVETIRQTARKSGLSTYMLAKLAGMPVAVAQRFMKGGGLRCATAEKLAGALNCTIELRPIQGRKAVK